MHLASRGWGLSIPATAVKLSGIVPDFPDINGKAILDYEAWHVYRKGIEDFWLTSKKKLYTEPSQEVSAMVGKLKLRCDVYGDWVSAGPQKLLGVGYHKDVEAAFQPNKEIRTTGKKSFNGGSWKNVLLTAYYDLPGRICGFWCIGRDLDLDKDVVYRRVGCRKTRKEAGLAFHPGLLTANTKTIFALPSTLMYLQMHMRQFRETKKVLPMVAWYAKGLVRTDEAWNMFRDKDIVFWSQGLTHELLFQAVRANGKIFLTNSKHEDWVSRNLKQHSAKTLLRSFKKGAKPWPKVLEKFVMAAEDAEVQELMLQYQSIDSNLDNVLMQCPNNVRKRIREALAEKGVGSAIRLGNREKVEERADGWWRVNLDRLGDEELIAGATVRIESAVHLPLADKTMYKGHIRFKGEEVPFSVDRDKLEKKGFRWVQDYLIQQQKGLCPYNSRYNNKLCTIATMFHVPDLEIGLEKVGWDDVKGAFVLPNYLINLQGEVEKHDGFVTDVPIGHIPLPKPLAQADLEPLLKHSTENRLFWATWCCLVANITAPAFCYPVRGLLLLGQSAGAAGAVAGKACGVVTKSLVQEDDTWPIHCTGRGADKKLLETDVRNIMVPTEWKLAAACLLDGGWHVLSSSRKAPTDKLLDTHMSDILPAYLVGMMKRKKYIKPRKEMVLTVLYDAIEWLDSLGLDSQVVRSCRKYIRISGGKHAKMFADILCSGLDEGLLGFAADGFAEKASDIVVFDDGYFMSRYALRRVCEEFKLPTPSINGVTGVLLKDGVLIGEQEVNGQTGWIVSRSWFDSCLHRWRLKKSGPLRIRRA